MEKLAWISLYGLFPNVELIKISLWIAKPFLKQVVDLVEMGGGTLQGQIKESLWMWNFCFMWYSPIYDFKVNTHSLQSYLFFRFIDLKIFLIRNRYGIVIHA